MEKIQKNSILQFHDDTLFEARKEIGLEKPGQIDEAIDILDDWVKKQNHFMKRDFSRGYLERTLLATKGSVERSKRAIDKLCTLKTLMPDFYVKVEDVPKLIEDLADVFVSGHLPKLTQQHYRVFMIKQISDNMDSNKIFKFHRYVVLLCEYLKNADYNNGYVIIIDFRSRNILNFVTKTNPMELQQAMTLSTHGYGLRNKGMHLLSESKMIDGAVGLLKQVVSEKVGGRIHVHKDIGTLYQYVDKYILPVEYGGQEVPLEELQKKWITEVCSREYLDYFNEQREARTDESRRLTNDFNEHYSGMPGSFRVLNVD